MIKRCPTLLKVLLPRGSDASSGGDFICGGFVLGWSRSSPLVLFAISFLVIVPGGRDIREFIIWSGGARQSRRHNRTRREHQEGPVALTPPSNNTRVLVGPSSKL